MNICFRVDASTNIGTGHIMRCLTFAEELRESGHTIYFVCRLHHGNLSHLIAEKGFFIYTLKNYEKKYISPNQIKHGSWLGTSIEQDALETKKVLLSCEVQFDWMIIDHYAIDKSWEQKIKELVPNILVIDDLADREHVCDILLDQNYYSNAYERYYGLIPKNCKLLLGPEYALLREEFIKLHESTKLNSKHKTVLIFYGGSDPTNDTIKAINAIESFDLTVHVVVGPTNQNKEKIEELCINKNMTFHYNINYMAKLMLLADFAICAGGSTTWERYCLGTPAVLTAVAYNQIELCENVHELGIDQYIGVHDSISSDSIKTAVESFLNINDITKLSDKARKIVDGNGKKRVSKYLSL
ncbi:UDP-2,4-diacetamido-2,4,6-trideoxy-beta-L-altropyranose hydrolase [Jeotgalibacillus salarius]|uniref:UDP-2,4-diacetamido-2,4, 6-trideoxy-beta-L-altropyranose hydrolase n=1 Tax=Jeotgalibacillus salarius TaxID=546023 RepID=A0A4Y8LMW2_9BACL|nr:UDP-2,4-diacetamido-2,4,6-trideoxy-beta-L-altropyranose hydrolase [Jeotgalibacillus salarius]TFE03933.1 UDP-2,4-diacetamido-2,4,6-trideoxy-beta-L-altropyranose hydrolase [Jeotgalibacillus salarius]